MPTIVPPSRVAAGSTLSQTHSQLIGADYCILILATAYPVWLCTHTLVLANGPLRFSHSFHPGARPSSASALELYLQVWWCCS